MASIEKLAKAFEALKVFQPGEKEDALTILSRKKEAVLTKKEKISNLNTISDCVCASTLRNVPDFPKYLSIAIETFLSHCCDSEADVRLKADECLNRIIKALLENNASRIQVELYKEIKKNGEVRSLRAALWRFADMCHLIRPQRCRPYVVNLLPCLTKICRRPEEALQETLAASMAKICPVLMPFTNNTETKILTKAFLPNLKSTSATIRRTAASCLSLIAQHSRKPATFYAWLLSLLLELALPVETVRPSAQWVGILLTLRYVVIYLGGPQYVIDSAVKEDLGLKLKDFQVEISKEQLIQVYELLLYLTNYSDSVVVTAALETLHQLLRSPPALLLPVLTSRGSIKSTSIYERDVAVTARSSDSSRKPSTVDDGDLQEDFDQAPDEHSSSSSSSSEDLSQFIGELDSGTMAGDEVTALSGARDALELKHSAGSMIFNSDLSTKDMVTETYLNMDLNYSTDDPRSPLSPLSQADTASDLGSGVTLESRPNVTANEDKVTTEELLNRDVDNIPANKSDSAKVLVKEGDIGSIIDQEAIPLQYCVRLLASKFLLTGYPSGLLPDSMARVSLKSLALNCIACVASLSPAVLQSNLHKASDSVQKLADVLSLSSHSDPQLRGVCSTLIGNQLQAQLVQERSSLWSLNDQGTEISARDLIEKLVTLISDSSSVTVRLALVAFRSCLAHLMNSNYATITLRALCVAMDHVNNSYWLVKVELLELISDLDFKVVYYTVSQHKELSAGDHHFCGHLNLQQRICERVIMTLLGDEDAKVRRCAATTLARMIPHLYYPYPDTLQDAIVATTREKVREHLDPVLSEWYRKPPPFLLGLVHPYYFDPTASTPQDLEINLSHIVSLVTEKLASSPSKHYVSGCCEAMSILLDSYPSTIYVTAWFSSSPAKTVKSKKSQNLVSSKLSDSASLMLGPVITQIQNEDIDASLDCGVLGELVSMLTSSAVTLDLTIHQHTLTAASLLFAGAAVKSLRSVDDVTLDSPLWVSIGNRLLVPIAEQLFVHILRLLNMFNQVIEENQSVAQSLIPKPTLPSLPNAPLLSPIRKKSKSELSGKDSQQSAPNVAGAEKVAKDSGKEGDKEKAKKESLGSVQGQLHYQKLQDIIRMAYTTYKISLDLSNQDRFCSLLRSTLEALSVVLEVTCLPKAVRCVEEVLSYLGSTITIESNISVLCVQQLLKALFGTNLASQWPVGNCYGDGKSNRLTSGQRLGLYHCCFTAPYTQFTQSLASASFRNTVHIEHEDTMSVISWLKRRAERKVPLMLRPNSKIDKSSVGSYIRLFESLVIKSLKLYNTSSLDLQEQVLDLLTQLLQLRVNYNLLDADQVFITYVTRQFEFIEEGQVSSPDKLIAAIFNFLIMLSYEKYNSRSIIITPKIIQLCEGIMASGQDPATHVIPALQPIVNDLFVVRGGVNKGEGGKDLDTQREVVVAMLFKLLVYHEVLDLLIIVLHQTHKEAEDKWRKLSRQIVDQLLPLLASQQVNLDSQRALDVVHRLFESVSPSVFRPVDIVLKMLFVDSSNILTLCGLQRWLSLVLTIMRVLIMQAKEDMVLSRLQELELAIIVRVRTVSRKQVIHSDFKDGADIFTLSHGAVEDKFACFLLQTIGIVASELVSINNEYASSKMVQPCFLTQQLSHLFLYITHMFQSGLYRRVCTATVVLCRQELVLSQNLLPLADINATMLSLGTVEPTLLLQWCNLLTLLNHTDRQWWSTVLQNQDSTDSALQNSSGLRHKSVCDNDEPVKPAWPCNMEIVKRGAVILYCDYACENVSDLEPMAWLIVGHIADLIMMAQEPPVQDFITAVQRNAAASGLFIEALSTRCEKILTQPPFASRALRCLKDTHIAASGSLLLLIVDKFLATYHVVIARLAESLACRRLEALLALSREDCSNLVPTETIKRLQKAMASPVLLSRYVRLRSLTERLCVHLSIEVLSVAASKREHPLVSVADDIVVDYHLNKEWFIALVASRCCSLQSESFECAQLLQHLDYCSILNIMMAKDCNLIVLSACITVGLQRTLKACEDARSMYSSLPSASLVSGHIQADIMDPLLQAAQITLCRRINVFINLLPVPHKLVELHSTDNGLLPEEKMYRDKLFDVLNNKELREAVLTLAGALRWYIACLFVLPWQPSVPYESARDIARFSVFSLEICHWLLVHNRPLPISQLEDCVGCLAAILQRPELRDIIGHVEQLSWACSVVQSVHQIVKSYTVEPGLKIVNDVKKPRHGDPEVNDKTDISISNVALAFVQISELVSYTHTHLVADRSTDSSQQLPKMQQLLLKNLIIGLAQLPSLNSYARTPRSAWPEEWSSVPLQSQVPSMPLEQLQDKDVLQDFIRRINVIGWSNRQQFEETWMYLLGVISILLQPSEEHNVKEEIETCHCAMFAVRGVTALLLNTLRIPQAGNLANSFQGFAPRNKPVAFLQTRAGKKLSVLRAAIEQYLQPIRTQRTGHATEGLLEVTGDGVDVTKKLYVNNVERYYHENEHFMGQYSSDSLWASLNVSPFNSTVQSRDQSPVHEERESSASFANGSIRIRRAPTSLDINSCIQLLLEVYGQLLSISAVPPTQPPLALYYEIIRSVVMVSDIFSQRHHFEWLLNVLLQVHSVHPVEDELVCQYIVYGVCKASAVAGLDSVTSEKVVRLIESSLRSPHLPVKISAFQGSLHILEAGSTEVSKQIIPMLLESLLRTLSPWAPSAVYSDQLFLCMVAVAFYLLEHFQSDVLSSGLDQKMIQIATMVMAASDETISASVFVSLVSGMERLVMTDRLTRQDATVLVKASTARLQASNPLRSITSLGLLLTCMYSGKHIDSGIKSVDFLDAASADSSSLLPELPSDPDTMVTILEKITVIFERMRRGLPNEALLFASILPQLLADLCPPQDIMNKVIGEFLSNQQPHPTVMARVVYEVFGNQLRCHQHALVHDWLLLSLSNFTQRTPFSLALWSQTVFFISASTTPWLRAAFIHVLARIGCAEPEDLRLFWLAALDFYTQLKSDEVKQVFLNTYRTVSQNEMAYAKLLQFCEQTASS